MSYILPVRTVLMLISLYDTTCSPINIFVGSCLTLSEYRFSSLDSLVYANMVGKPRIIFSALALFLAKRAVVYSMKTVIISHHNKVHTF